MSTKSSDEYWDGIGPRILRELNRRLTEGGSAKDLPASTLMKLAEQYLRHLDRLAAKEADDQPYMSALEAVEQPGLPIDSKIQILTDYITAQQGEIDKAKTRIVELQLEILGGNGDDIPALQQL